MTSFFHSLFCVCLCFVCCYFSRRGSDARGGEGGVCGSVIALHLIEREAKIGGCVCACLFLSFLMRTIRAFARLHLPTFT